MSERSASEPIVAEGLAPPIGPYSPGRTLVAGGRWIITSGQTGVDPATGKVVDGGVSAQTASVMENIRNVLRAGGADLKDVVKTTVFLRDMADFAAMNEAYARAFGDHKPARTTVAVLGLPQDSLVEIEAWAYRP